MSRDSGEHSLSMLLVLSFWALEFCLSFMEVLRVRLWSLFSILLRRQIKKRSNMYPPKQTLHQICKIRHHIACVLNIVQPFFQCVHFQNHVCKTKYVCLQTYSVLYLGDMWFWDSVLQSFPTVLVIRSVLTSQLLTSTCPGPLSSVSGS